MSATECQHLRVKVMRLYSVVCADCDRALDIEDVLIKLKDAQDEIASLKAVIEELKIIVDDLKEARNGEVS